jgi:hypothetical protein
MTTLAPVLPRVSKLLPLLSSDHEGEVVAAARAIGRILGCAGLSWHDLARAITGSAKDGVMPSPSWSRMSRQQRLHTLDRLLALGHLSAWERAFCNRIHAAIHLWPRSEQSPKQTAILDGLISKALR